jgi:hypothetical protein
MLQPDPHFLKELLTYEMPFGKYKGWRILDIPVYYLEWMEAKGFPEGKLGMMLSTAHVIKTNGLMHLLPKQ